jgi:glucose 1-dehydrogenase
VRAITVEPGRSGSIELAEIDEPSAAPGMLLVQCRAVGICGTDREIIAGAYGWAPPGGTRLVLGHESLGRVLEAPPGAPFAKGDLVVGIVRRPDPVPCSACAAGQWDMCRNGRYVERGIKERDGYMAERFTLEPAFAIGIDSRLGERGVLLEPTSIVAKAWAHIEAIGHRAVWTPRIALVTGAGPIGLLAALLGVQRGFEVHVMDRAAKGAKPSLVAALGATYHVAALDSVPPPDVVLECTGAASVILDCVQRLAPDGIVCLAGVPSGVHKIDIDVSTGGRAMVLGNEVLFGAVNANRAHYEEAATALLQADPAWLDRLITRRVPLARWREAFERHDGDIKVVLDFEADA